MSNLIRYEQARTALAECYRVDEVKDIRDKAEAMAAYARQAKDSELIQYATEIKVRAERRCGELLRDSERNTGVRMNGPDVERCDTRAPTLADIGLTRDQSSRYQQLAAMPDEHFETAVATAKATAGEVTTAFMLREANKTRPRKKLTAAAKQRLSDLNAAQDRADSLMTVSARIVLTALQTRRDFAEPEKSVLKALFEELQKVSFLGGEQA